MGLIMGSIGLGGNTRTVGNTAGAQFPATYAGLQAALDASGSGDSVIILSNSAVPGSLSATINVPYGVTLMGAGPRSSTIAMPAGTPTVPTITFRGNNWVEGIGLSHRDSSVGTEGGICLCGSNHTFVNCLMDGNQDCLMLGDVTLTSAGSAIGSADWNGSTTLTKTNAFASYTWASGDVFICTGGGTIGMYAITSKTASTLVLGTSLSGSVLTGTVEGIVCAQYHQWGGGTQFRDCKFTNWNFDFVRINGVQGQHLSSSPAFHTLGIGVQDLSFQGCSFAGASGSKFLIDWVLTTTVDDCLFDSPAGSWTFVGGGSPQVPAGRHHKPAIVITGATSNAGGTTITATGAFATYVFRPGDTLIVASGTGATPGTYVVTGKVSNDAITIAASLGASATSVAAVLYPPYRLSVLNSTIRMGSVLASNGLFKVQQVATPAAGTCGPRIEIDNLKLEVATAPTTIFRGSSYANPSPKAQFIVKNTVLPYSSAPHSGVGATPAAANNPPIYFYNSTCVGTVAANGSTSSDPADVWFTTCTVTAGDGTKGVRLTAPIGEEQTIRNNSGSALKVYPVAGGDIDGAGTDVAYSLAANTTKTFRRMTSTVWWSQ